jgi:UDP-glucose 4-epimerase
MSKKVAVVTGGAGFIGSHTVDLLLEKNYSVRIIDNFSGGHEKNLINHKYNPDLKIYNEDIRSLSPTSSIFNNANYVFHYAGIGDIIPSIENPSSYFDVNVQGTIKVLECARNANVEKFLYAASSSCYGIAETPTSESHLIQPQYPYALSKYQGEQAAIHWAQIYRLPVISIRIFNAYGTRVRTTGAYGAVFGVFLKQKLEKKKLTVVGDGTQQRDFIYVTDVANAFYRAASSISSTGIYNLGGGAPKSIKYLVELLDGKVEYLPKRPGEPEITWADITKVRNEFNWIPKVSFEQGVAKMVENINDWVDAPLWSQKRIAKATESWFKYLEQKT